MKIQSIVEFAGFIEMILLNINNVSKILLIPNILRYC